MRPLIFLVMAYTPLYLTDSGLVGTGEATTQLYYSALVEMAKSLLVLGVTQHQSLYNQTIQLQCIQNKRDKL